MNPPPRGNRRPINADHTGPIRPRRFNTSSSESSNTTDPDERTPVRQRLKAVASGAKTTWDASRQVLKLVWSTSRSLTMTLALATLAQSIVPAAQVWLAGQLIQAVADGISAGAASRDQAVQTIILLAVAQLVVLLGSSFAQTSGNVSQQLLQERLSIHIQSRIMRHAASLDLADFENAAYYDQLQRAQQESNHRPVQMVSQIFSLARSAVTFSTLLALLVTLGPLIAAATLLAPIPAFISGSRYGWQGFHLMRRQSPIRRMMGYLTQLLTTDEYAKEIKLYSLGDHFIDRYENLASEYYRTTKALIVMRYWAGFGWGSLTTLASSGTFLYVAIQAVSGVFTLGQLTVFTGAATQIQGAFQGLLGGFQGIYEHGLYLSTLDELLERKPAIASPANPIMIRKPFQQGIEFRNVTYTYPGNDYPSIQNVSFTIEPGETVALVGRNGAGKSTIVKLLGRLYDPDEGEILIDGVDIRRYDLDALRRQFAVMFQDYATYQLSVRDNVSAGDIFQETTDAAVDRATRQAGADPVIERLPDGLNTILGRWFEGGHQLSGGEWQKVALARAFMRDAADAQILVLDEPTAALDAKAEHELFARLRELSQHRMSINISHRFSTVRMADRILVLDRGRLIEEGTHDELVLLGGQYAELFTLQAESYR
jgi:ATP-binding cassette subfamily B protein